MNLGVAILIVNLLGRSQDLEMDGTGSWGSMLRVQVSLDVNLLLKRALKVQLMIGEELLVHFSNELLPNFFYLYGRFGHIAKHCELHFANDFVDPGGNPPYGPWLRAAVLGGFGGTRASIGEQEGNSRMLKGKGKVAVGVLSEVSSRPGRSLVREEGVEVEGRQPEMVLEKLMALDLPKQAITRQGDRMDSAMLE
ncbi:UNVERIFIED_CONTAM: hypothetical protein Sindi_0977400 [Sesamum indicum]